MTRQRRFVILLTLSFLTLVPLLAEAAQTRGVPRNRRQIREPRREREQRDARRARRAVRRSFDPRVADPIASKSRPGEYRVTRDSSGRTLSVEGWLVLRTGELARTPRETGMHRGHLIARQFGGRGDRSNIVSMNPRINTSYVKTFENSLARRLREGERIYLRARTEYGKDARVHSLHYDVYRGDGPRIRYQGTYSLDPRRNLPVRWTDAVGREARSWWYDFTGSKRPETEN